MVTVLAYAISKHIPVVHTLPRHLTPLRKGSGIYMDSGI